MRIFLALKLSDPEKKNIDNSLKEYYSHFKSFRWTRPENYHCTLFFLGEKSESEVQELQELVSQYDLTERCEPLKICRADCFHKNDHSTVLKLPIEPPFHWLKDLYSILKPLLDSYASVGHNQFMPHITIARTKHKLHKFDLEFIEAHPLFITLNFDTVVLYQSTSDDEGLLYKPLAEYPLRVSPEE